MTPYVWMFISVLRSTCESALLDETTHHDAGSARVQRFLRLGDRSSVHVHVCRTVTSQVSTARSSSCRTSRVSRIKRRRRLKRFRIRTAAGSTSAAQDEFKKIPGSPVAYWVSERVRESIRVRDRLERCATPEQGMHTGDNDRFLRYWYEVSIRQHWTCDQRSQRALQQSGASGSLTTRAVRFGSGTATTSTSLNWENDGHEIVSYERRSRQPIRSHEHDFYFHEGITWSDLRQRSCFRCGTPGWIHLRHEGPVRISADDRRRILITGLA